MTRRVFSVVTLLVLAASPVFAQTPPPVDRLPTIPRVTDPARPDVGYAPWLGTALTVAVVFGADCQPCRESIPFYKSLATRPGMDRKTQRFVVLTEGGIWPVVEIISSHPQGFQPDRALSYPSDDRFQVKTLPTLLVFDGTGARRGEWRGRLTASQEAEVVAVIDRILRDAKAGGKR